MTCKDCIHSGVCKYRYRQLPLSDCTHDESNKIEKIGCPFADKAKVVELPCKVGDTVYFIDFDLCNKYLKIYKTTVDEFVTDKFDTFAVLNIIFTQFTARRAKAVSIKNFGETAFLTREEAEKALKKR